MVERDPRPLYLTDAKAGVSVAGFPNYTIGNPTNFNKIQWECANTGGFARLNQRKAKPPEGYEWLEWVEPSLWKKKEADAIPHLGCSGDFIDPVKRYANRYIRKYDRKYKMQCCLNKLNPSSTQKLCDPAWKFETTECDDTVSKWCAENPKDPACGCFLDSKEYAKSKLLGPPECIDARCAGNPRAYKTQSMLNKNCPNVVNCKIDKTNIEDIKNSNISGIQYEQNCGISLEDAIKMVEESEGKSPPEESEGKSPPEEGEGKSPPEEGDGTILGLNMWAFILGITGIVLAVIGMFLIGFAGSSSPRRGYYVPPPQSGYYAPPLPPQY